MSASAGRALRILLAGPGQNFKYGGRYFYSFARRLANGFTRNGHLVLPFSDRDTADYALGIRAIGGRLSNTRLLGLARETRPDLLVLQHAHLITPATIEAVREAVPACRVAVVYCDTTYVAATATRFGEAIRGVDFAFNTTGGEELRRFAVSAPVAFVPNPIDLSIDRGRAFAAAEHRADIFYACGKPATSARWRLAMALRARLPALDYAYYGRDKRDLIWGDAYMSALSASRIGLNLNHAEGGLYASDRMAQYLGNGLLLATDRRSGYDHYFDDDAMLHFDGMDDLAAGIERTLRDGTWRQRAERGRARALAIMGEQRVAAFIASMTLGEGVPVDWPFAAHVFARA
jgi:hypothetical protein